MQELWSIYHYEIPEFLCEFAAVPPMQRLKAVGMNCGCEYTSFKPIVEEIKLNNVPEVKLGEMPDTLVTIPKDANYIIYDAHWYVWDDENACF